MIFFAKRALFTLAASLLLGGCGASEVAAPAYVKPQAAPALGAGTPLALPKTVLPVGVTPIKSAQFHQVVLTRGEGKSKLWIYRPLPIPKAKVPCVLIAPAGTDLAQGIALGDGDRDEHYPYVRAGMVVVAYELDGQSARGNDSDAETIRTAREFMAADGGLKNAQDALDYALANVPEVDPSRIYVAGHSSAATVALHVAQNEPRVAACLAYAPATDLRSGMNAGLFRALGAEIDGYDAFLDGYSPQPNAAKLQCPLFLFHADDDQTIPKAEVTAFADAVRATNSKLTFYEVKSGGHYDSMISQGVPQGISWLRALPGVANWQPAQLAF